MIKLSIFHMNAFLRAADSCTDAVYLVCRDGTKKNINKQYDIQQDLRKQHKENKNYLRLTLDTPNYDDYLKLVYFFISNC
ncbi:ribonuclease HII [Clostridium sp. AM58-1XD]|uniref:ribonuclease HII n=1 Tax=Clostridium sp. AM58-1XD TaxID=2292307 RepID=UPI000E4C3FF7|nr:ribonuclease HII [Clostridium sp. AM58-1XD]RGY97035.1 ribonuclease HII [Clostridium sp. AM58-1XD]